MKTGINTKTLLILSVVVLMAFSGCTAPSEQVIKTPDVTAPSEQATNTPVLEVPVGSGPDWCKTGPVMVQGPGGALIPDGGGNTIKGITTYEGKEVCESSLSYDGLEGSYKIYWNKDFTFHITVVTDKFGKETITDRRPKLG